jgi:hypothetical protein
LGIREAADAMVGYIDACGVNREERLLDLPNRVWGAMELGIHRGATVALTVEQVHSGHVLHHLVGFQRARSRLTIAGLERTLTRQPTPLST